MAGDEATTTTNTANQARSDAGQRVQLVTDSSASLPPDMPAHLRAGIRFVRTSVQFGNQSYPEGTLPLDSFYERIKNTGEIPRSSQPSPQEFLDAYADAVPHGPVLAILLSAALSGTFSSGVLAARQLPQADIHIFDSHYFSSALGYMVAEAAALADEGQPREVILKQLYWRRANTQLFLTVDTLEFLRHSGRVSGLQALLATALNIKPIIKVAEGKLRSVGRERSRRRSLERLLSNVEAQAAHWEPPFWVSAMHGHAAEDAAWLLEQMQQRLPVARGYVSEAPASVALHGGPGVVGVMITPAHRSQPAVAAPPGTVSE